MSSNPPGSVSASSPHARRRSSTREAAGAGNGGVEDHAARDVTRDIADGGAVALPAPASGVPRLLVVGAILAVTWIALSGANALNGFIAPLFFVINLWIIAYPVQRVLMRAGLPRVIGGLAAGLVIVAILVGFLFAISWAISALVQELTLPAYQSRFTELYTQLTDWLEGIGISQTQILDQLQSISPSNVAQWAAGFLGSFSGAATATFAVITILVGVVTDAHTLLQRFLMGVRTQPGVVTALVSFCQGVRKYWIVSAIFGLIVAVADVVLLYVMGIPLALVWGVLSFLTNFIPNIGFVLGVIPPALMALFAKDPGTALLVVILYFVLNASIQSFIQPKFNGDAVGVTATVAILSLLLWTWALGPLGALLGIPATLLVKALFIDSDPRLRWLNAFIAADPRQAQDEPEVRKSSTASLVAELLERDDAASSVVVDLANAHRPTRPSEAVRQWVRDHKDVPEPTDTMVPPVVPPRSEEAGERREGEPREEGEPEGPGENGTAAERVGDS